MYLYISADVLVYQSHLVLLHINPLKNQAKKWHPRWALYVTEMSEGSSMGHSFRQCHQLQHIRYEAVIVLAVVKYAKLLDVSKLKYIYLVELQSNICHWVQEEQGTISDCVHQLADLYILLLSTHIHQTRAYRGGFLGFQETSFDYKPLSQLNLQNKLPR